MEIKAIIHYCQNVNPESPTFGEVCGTSYNPASIYEHHRLLHKEEFVVDIEVPDPREEAVAMLEKKISSVQAEAQAEVTRIKGVIQTLLALEAPKPASGDDDIPF